jgi:hypothetical protein
MKQKTAIQELLDFLEDKHGDILFQFPNLLSNIDTFLELEKDQIINAFLTGDRSDCLKDQDSKSYAEQYYQVRFGDNPEAGI